MSWISKWLTPRKRPASADLPDVIKPEAGGKRLRVTAAEPTQISTDVVHVTNSGDSIGLLRSALVPRPLALVSLINEAGELVIAPTTTCSFVTDSVVSLLLTGGDAATKELASKEFIISLVTEDIVEAALASVGRHPLAEGSAEFELKGGLSTSASAGRAACHPKKQSSENPHDADNSRHGTVDTQVAVPRIAQAAVSLECSPLVTLDITHSSAPQEGSQLLLAEVMSIASWASLLTQSVAGHPILDANKLALVAWLGNNQCSTLTAPRTLELPVLPQGPAAPATPASALEQAGEQEAAAPAATDASAAASAPGPDTDELPAEAAAPELAAAPALPVSVAV